MSIKYNGKLIAGKYKTQVVTDATEGNKGLIRIATLEEVNAGTDNTTAVTPKGLATKQDKLTAGTGIEITGDNVINNTQTSAEWGNIQGSILDQSDLIDEFDKKQDVIPDLENIREGANKGSTSVQAGDNISTLINDTGYLTNSTLPIGSDTQKGIVQVDNTTIESNDGVLTSIATKTKSNTIKIDWEGTNAEYEAGIADGSISPDWYCYITDDETMVDFNDFANNSLSNLSEEGQAIIDHKSSVDLDNLTESGEKHFLNKSQITNCLLEVPQRIKYTLENGTLTIKAGSVVIVPYGTTDQSATYPVGSTFLNDNFKVYDTQFSDGKFFVWAELLIDVTRSSFGSDGTILGFINFNNAGNLGDVTIGQALSSNVGSGTSDPNTGYYYRTDENKVYISGNWYGYSLPIIEAIVNGTTVTSVNQVFNGMGYIGSTVWVDKGVTAVCGQGCNADGTIKNATYKHSGIELVDLSDWDAVTNSYAGYLIYIVSSSRNNFWFQPYARFYTSIDPIGSTNAVCYSYVEKERQWYVWDGDSNKQYWEKAQVYIYAEMTTKDNKAFKPKPPFRAADYNDIDGEYSFKKRLVVSSKEDLSVASGVNVNYNLSDFLPKDNNSYLVLTHIAVQTGASAGAYCHVWTASSDSVEGISCGGNTTSAARQTFISKGWTLVRPDRILRTFRSCSGSAGILYTLAISAYRKVR